MMMNYYKLCAVILMEAILLDVKKLSIQVYETLVGVAFKVTHFVLYFKILCFLISECYDRNNRECVGLQC